MKSIRRILSIVMTIVVLFVFEIGTSAIAMAESERAETAIGAYNEANNFGESQELAYSSLVGEVVTGRKESMRSFRRADGIMETVLYSMAVNYLEQGEWKAIDTLF